jgi:hypothetical protein
MQANLYPIIYNPGIQRDGSQFQGDYCLDGQWIRFQRGKVKKIGGMKGIAPQAPIANVTNLTIVPWTGGGEEVLTFISHREGIYVITSSIDWEAVRSLSILDIVANPTTLWETTTVIDKGGQNTSIVFMQTPNGVNINQNSASTFYVQNIATPLVAPPIQPLVGVDPLINGGLCFAAPYLFLYGSNGLIQYSTLANTFEFKADDKATISSDKVIFGSPIRGGSNSPSLLFWTLSSVVRVTNAATGEKAIGLKSDTISKSSSILSSRCVVEYDGLFFWAGTDRFFVYNGIVQEMDNRMNLNYFYDNLDMNYRQNVFGVKQTKFGEIWWFYPVKGDNGVVKRAIVYNKRENFWYDVDLPRTAGTFSNDFGFMATFGSPLVNNDNTQHLWKHEVGESQEWRPAGDKQIDSIPSSFTTPIFSWVAFPPKPSRGASPSQFINRWMDLQRIEPDFVVPTGDESKFHVIVNTQEYAQSPVVNSNPIQFTNDTPKIDMRVQGRNMSLTFGSSSAFEAGQIILLVGTGDER